MTSKISVYSLSELKTTLDDHLPAYLTSPNLPPGSTPLPKPLRFTQSHLHTNVRLALGYAAVAISLYIFYLDYYLKIPFSEHKGVTAYAVVVYFLLNAALTVWIWRGERGVVFAGERKGGTSSDGKGVTSVRLASLAPHKKYEPVYRLLAEWSVIGAAGKQEQGKAEVLAPFTMFFQGDGTFVPGQFEAWLKKSVPVIGGASEKGAVQQTPMSPKQRDDVSEEGDVIVVETPGQREAAGSTPGTKKRSKRKA